MLQRILELLFLPGFLLLTVISCSRIERINAGSDKPKCRKCEELRKAKQRSRSSPTDKVMQMISSFYKIQRSYTQEIVRSDQDSETRSWASGDMRNNNKPKCRKCEELRKPKQRSRSSSTDKMMQMISSFYKIQRSYTQEIVRSDQDSETRSWASGDPRNNRLTFLMSKDDYFDFPERGPVAFNALEPAPLPPSEPFEQPPFPKLAAAPMGKPEVKAMPQVPPKPAVAPALKPTAAPPSPPPKPPVAFPKPAAAPQPSPPKPPMAAPQAFPKPPTAAPRAIPKPPMAAPRAIPKPPMAAPRAIPKLLMVAPQTFPKPNTAPTPVAARPPPPFARQAAGLPSPYQNPAVAYPQANKPAIAPHSPAIAAQQAIPFTSVHNSKYP